MAKIRIDETLTRKVADLARLELTDREAAMFTSQLGQILEYVEQLQEVSVEGIEPLTHPLELTTPLREDRVRASPVNGEGKPRVLESAPEVLQDSFKVPPVL